jgi:hypothetical protein
LHFPARNVGYPTEQDRRPPFRNVLATCELLWLQCEPSVISVRNKNERVELEMQIMKYRQLTSRTADEEFLKRVKEKIEELEAKLREIDV